MRIEPTLVRQAGAVPVRAGQVCLVTSRSGKRWVVPKGHMEPGKSASEIALQEAWEEAGLVGLVRHDPLGSYFYEKDGLLCHVIVFQLEVTAQADAYPEVGQRQRIWLPAPQAVSYIEEPGLRDILRAISLPLAG
jgi:8-oxo-dGTP pyrophosphatase MutT (NUDIX family)